MHCPDFPISQAVSQQNGNTKAFQLWQPNCCKSPVMKSTSCSKCFPMKFALYSTQNYFPKFATCGNQSLPPNRSKRPWHLFWTNLAFKHKAPLLPYWPGVGKFQVEMPSFLQKAMAPANGKLHLPSSMSKSLACKPLWPNCGPYRPWTNTMPNARWQPPMGSFLWAIFCSQCHTAKAKAKSLCCCLTSATVEDSRKRSVCAAVVSSQTFKGHGGSSKAKMASSIKKCLQMPCDGKTMLDTQKYTFVFCFFQFGFLFFGKTLCFKKTSYQNHFGSSKNIKQG